MVVVPEVDETFGDGPVREEVRRVAERKACAAGERLTEGVVIAGDTVVEVEGEALGKPRDEEEARQMLGRLSGRGQQVHTGVAVLRVRDGALLSATETTLVVMREISPVEIAAYVASGEAMGKAGAYAVQETGDRFVERIEGPFDNVVGLPMERLAALLAELARVALGPARQ